MKFYLIVPMNHHYKNTNTTYLPKYDFVLRYRLFYFPHRTATFPKEKKFIEKPKSLKL